jgi:hypothetical protein
MRRLKDQTGATLIMVICIAAALFVMGATLVMVTANTQEPTQHVKSKDKALALAEADMESAVYQVGASWPSESPSPSPSMIATPVVCATPVTTAVTSWFSATTSPCPSPSPEFGLATMQQQVTYAPYSYTDANGTTQWDSTKLWIISNAAISGQKAAIKCLVQQHTTGVTTVVPNVALYSGGSVTMTGSTVVTGSAAALETPGTLNVSGDGVASFTAGIYAGTLTQTTSWQTFVDSGKPTATMSTLWPASTITTLTAQSQTASAYAAGGASATLVSNSSPGFVNPWGGTWGNAYSTGDLHVNTQGTYNFTSLYVNGNLTVDGSAILNCSNLYVTGSLTVSGGAGTNNLTNVYVGGDVNFSGSHVFSISLLVTAGNVTDGGSQNIGSTTTPTMLIQTGTGKTCNISGYCPFTGVIVQTSSTSSVTVSGSCCLDGAVFTAGTTTMSGSGGITYDATVIGKFSTVQSTAATLIPDTWEEIQPTI